MIIKILALSGSFPPTIDERIIAKGRKGMDDTISVSLWRRRSTVPPKKPEIPPIVTPIITEIITETAPMVIVILPPFTIRFNKSLPSSSVPKR